MKAISTVLLLHIFGCYVTVEGLELSSMITLCSASDPQLSQCVKEAGQKLIPLVSNGVPEWKVPPLDPMKTPHVVFEQNKGDVNLKMEYDNVVQTGISLVIFEDAKIDVGNKVWEFQLRYPFFTFTADYKANGRMLDFDVQGTGKANITLWDSISFVTIKYKVENDRIVEDSISVRYTFNKIFLDYTNLNVNNDPELSASAGTFINENSAEILNGFKSELENFYRGIISDSLKGFFEAIPYSTLFA